jgi:hypothetical protein
VCVYVRKERSSLCVYPYVRKGNEGTKERKKRGRFKLLTPAPTPLSYNPAVDPYLGGILRYERLKGSVRGCFGYRIGGVIVASYLADFRDFASFIGFA